MSADREEQAVDEMTEEGPGDLTVTADNGERLPDPNLDQGDADEPDPEVISELRHQIDHREVAEGDVRHD